MKKPPFSHAAWFGAGAICGGATLYILSFSNGTIHPTPSLEAVVAQPAKPELSSPSLVAATPDLDSILDRALRGSPSLRRSRDFLDFLETVTAANWQTAWTEFSTRTKGREALYEMDAQLLLSRIGEVAGEAGVTWFLETKEGEQAKGVMTAWAGFDPQLARAWFLKAPNSTDLGPALIRGTGLHSMESLLEFAGSGQTWALRDCGSELIAAARLKGTPAEGEQLWREFLRQAEMENPAEAQGLKDGGYPKMFNALTEWQVEFVKFNGTPAGAREWLSGIINEGYRMSENILSAVGAAAGEADPEGTLQWASEMAVQLADGDPMQAQRITRQQGFAAAKRWAGKDANTLSRWLSANPGHLGYDAGAAALYLTLKDTDPVAAEAWGAVVKDGSLRQWTRLDPPPP